MRSTPRRSDGSPDRAPDPREEPEGRWAWRSDGLAGMAGALAARLPDDGRPVRERERLAALVALLATLPPPPDRFGLMPAYGRLHAALIEAIATADGETLEGAFLDLYCHLHGHAAPYDPGERAVVDRTGGYWCHAGGLSPVLKAPDWITPASRSIDLGAGNGLQLLLVQRLAPHALAVQVEISRRMCEAGRDLQRWLEIPDERVEWRVADVTEQSVSGYDLVYLYRPVRPEGEGETFYRRLGRELATAPGDPVVLSVADCLRPYLPEELERFHFDGHLACYRRAR